MGDDFLVRIKDGKISVGSTPKRVSGDGCVEESTITEAIWYWVRNLHYEGTPVNQIPLKLQEHVSGVFITVETVKEILK